MNFSLLWAILLSISPISELRGGIPYAILNGINPLTAFIVCVLANIAIIIFIFFFLDFLHNSFMKLSIYRKIFGFFLERTRKKVDEVEKKMGIYGFLALTIFVAIPLPATGAWTGCLIAWILGLDRKKSILAISLGVFIAGLIVLLTTIGLIKLFS